MLRTKKIGKEEVNFEYDSSGVMSYSDHLKELKAASKIKSSATVLILLNKFSFKGGSKPLAFFYQKESDAQSDYKHFKPLHSSKPLLMLKKSTDGKYYSVIQGSESDLAAIDFTDLRSATKCEWLTANLDDESSDDDVLISSCTDFGALVKDKAHKLSASELPKYRTRNEKLLGQIQKLESSAQQKEMKALLEKAAAMLELVAYHHSCQELQKTVQGIKTVQVKQYDSLTRQLDEYHDLVEPSASSRLKSVITELIRKTRLDLENKMDVIQNQVINAIQEASRGQSHLEGIYFDEQPKWTKIAFLLKNAAQLIVDSDLIAQSRSLYKNTVLPLQRELQRLEQEEGE